MSNKYFKGAKISEGTFRRIVRSFAADKTATEASRETGVSVRSVNPIFLRIRERIAEFGDVALHAPSVQVGTFRFGPRAIRGTPGRGAERKTIVLIMYGEDDKVFLEAIPNETKATIYPILKGCLPLETEILTNGMRTFDSLPAIGFKKHLQTKREITAFQNRLQSYRTSEIQQFWWGTERSLKKFLGLPMNTRRLHLKERAFRHNMRNEDLYLVLLELLRSHPL
jgi:hypothetical protein